MNAPSAVSPAPDDGAALAACDAVLFDLDGTLADTAPDLAAAVNLMRHTRGLAPALVARVRGPVGLDVGAEGPGEIAASILAQLIAEVRRPTAG